MNPEILLEVSKEARGAAMPGIDISTLSKSERLQDRGW
jgi:pyridoxal biosynthesis lyase PdxS